MDVIQRLLTDVVELVARSTGDVLLITVLFTLFVITVFFGMWVYNRRKFQNLSHQIPATVVKSYLDTIIQNSTSLKESLFRGGGLDVGEGIPSIKPVGDLSSGGVDTSHLQEQINQKNAEISSLKGTVTQKDGIIADLERKLKEAQDALASGDSGAQIAELTSERDQLKIDLQAAQDALAAASAGGGEADPALQGQLDDVTKERDALKEKLDEYAIIEEDLANLKKLQKENEELKAQLAGGAAVAAAAPAAAEEPPPPAEEPAAEEEEEDLEAAMAAAIGEADAPAEEAPAEEAPAEEGEEKSAEELLSEFEKMLG